MNPQSNTDHIPLRQACENLQIGKAGEYLVCADLILKGHIAFPSEQGLPYDVVAEIGQKLYRVQVKTTRTIRAVPQRKTHTDAYLFWIGRCGKNGNKKYGPNDVDLMALVALDVNVIGYIAHGYIRKTMHVNLAKLKEMTLDEELLHV